MRRCRRFGLYIPAKEVQKSVRITEEVYSYIMQFDGDSFSDKFAKLVINHAKLTGHTEIDR